MSLPLRMMLSFLVLLFVMTGCATEEENRQFAAARERQKQVDAQAAARKEFASKISEKFELPGSRRCVVDFFAEGQDNTTLLLRPCSILTERREKLNLYKVFDSATMQEVKKLGFTRMETEQDGETVYMPIQ